MNYIILDLEWNQGSDRETPEDGLNFEIIEIGAVKMNEDGVMVDEFSRLIKPQVYHEMHRITSKLIHMQMQELERGDPFVDVMTEFLNWCGEEEYRFCTWGGSDLIELQKNMRYYDMAPLADAPFPYLDVQKMFSLAYEDGKSRRTLEYAVDFLKLEKDIPFHRAFSDAYYACKVLAILPRKIYANVSYDVFQPPRRKEDEVRVQFDTYAKYISRVFSDKPTAFTDWEVISTKCYVCHKNLKKRIRWFTPNGKNYYSVAACDKHGYVKSKLRVRKPDAQSEEVFVIKTTKFITPEEAASIRERQVRAKELRKRHRTNKKDK